jgi:hypothetical protein
MNKRNWKLVVIAGGFYYFGEEIESSQEGYITLKDSAMFGGFGGGKGVAAVCRGESSATVILDRFEKNQLSVFPISCCYGIHDCVNLYEFSGTTLR